MRVFLEDLMDAMDWSDADSFLNVETGAILTLYDGIDDAWDEYGDGGLDEDDIDDPELANFVRNEDQYLRLPDRYDIDEYRIMRHFAWSRGDDAHSSALMRAIQGRGAFRRFKDTCYRLGIEQQWYDYKEARLMEIAREWCAENGVAYAYRFPERVLARRRFTKAEVEAAADAPVSEGDETFYGGFFGFNYTTLTAEIEREGHELEEVELDVDLWLRNQGGSEPNPPEGYEPWREPLLLKISPDRRLVAPDDDGNHALLYCCVLVDAAVWLHAARREGRETLKARLVPMEIHERHICKRKASYVGYWNSEIDDMMGYAKRKRERERR